MDGQRSSPTKARAQASCKRKFCGAVYARLSCALPSWARGVEILAKGGCSRHDCQDVLVPASRLILDLSGQGVDGCGEPWPKRLVQLGDGMKLLMLISVVHRNL